MNDIEKVDSIPVEYDENGNALVVFENGVHFVVNGDFQITAKGEVSLLSTTVMSLDCALLLLNCRLSKQIRDIKEEMRTDFIDMLGGLPDMTPGQMEYVIQTKQKVKQLLNLSDSDISHIKEKSGSEDDEY